jgi:hypothetical protein
MRVLLVGALPAFMRVAMVRRGIPLCHGWTAAMAAAGAASVDVGSDESDGVNLGVNCQ